MLTVRLLKDRKIITLRRTITIGAQMKKICVEKAALPAGFAKLQYPPVSSYLMTLKSLTESKSPSHGWQATSGW